MLSYFRGDITKSKAAEAPEALLRLVDLHLKTGKPLDPSYVDISAALAWEHRKTDQGVALERASVLAASLARNFDISIERLSMLEQRGDLDQIILGHLTKNADDVTFAKYALLSWYDETGPNVKMAKDRLIALGFKREVEQLGTTHVLEGEFDAQTARNLTHDNLPKPVVAQDDPFFSSAPQLDGISETKSAQLHLVHSQTIRKALDVFLAKATPQQDQK